MCLLVNDMSTTMWTQGRRSGWLPRQTRPILSAGALLSARQSRPEEASSSASKGGPQFVLAVHRFYRITYSHAYFDSQLTVRAGPSRAVGTQRRMAGAYSHPAKLHSQSRGLRDGIPRRGALEVDLVAAASAQARDLLHDKGLPKADLLYKCEPPIAASSRSTFCKRGV
jgi:hypothetical protein